MIGKACQTNLFFEFLLARLYFEGIVANVLRKVFLACAKPIGDFLSFRSRLKLDHTSKTISFTATSRTVHRMAHMTGR